MGAGRKEYAWVEVVQGPGLHPLPYTVKGVGHVPIVSG
jgi:hypothetical protein